MAGPSEVTDASFGSRHRAAIGVSRDTDALVIVVSEESGYIRIAQRGVLSSPIDPKDLEHVIRDELGHRDVEEPAEVGSEKLESDDQSGFADDEQAQSAEEKNPESLMIADEQPEASPEKGGGS